MEMEPGVHSTFYFMFVKIFYFSEDVMIKDLAANPLVTETEKMTKQYTVISQLSLFSPAKIISSGQTQSR